MISDILIINFELNKRVILALKIINVLPEMIGIGFETYHLEILTTAAYQI
jgi:hypothetical protein